MEGNTEDMWNKPTLNRELSYALLSEKTDFHWFLYLFATSFSKKLLWREGETENISFISLTISLTIQNICQKINIK